MSRRPPTRATLRNRRILTISFFGSATNLPLVRSGFRSKIAPGRASSGIGNWEGQASEMQVFVRDNDINSALRVLKRKMQREGLFRELRRRRAYEKPSERRARERAEGGRRRRKALTKRMLREGY